MASSQVEMILRVCRCARCRTEWLEQGWYCPEVLSLQSPERRQTLDATVDCILSHFDDGEVVLRYNKSLHLRGIQQWLADSGIIIGRSVAYSIWGIKKWRWLVLAYYTSRNYTRRSLRTHVWEPGSASGSMVAGYPCDRCHRNSLWSL